MTASIITTLPNTLVNGTTADAGQVQANFTSIQSQVNANGVDITSAQTIGGAKTWSALNTFSSGITISAGGLTISSGTFSVQSITSATGITVTAGGMTVSAGTSAFQAVTATTVTTSGVVATVGLTSSAGLTVSSGLSSLQAVSAVSGAFSGAVSASSFTGAGTGLTGTAGSLTVGAAASCSGNAATATLATAVNGGFNSAGSANVPFSGITMQFRFGRVAATIGTNGSFSFLGAGAFPTACVACTLSIEYSTSSNGFAVDIASGGLSPGGVSYVWKSWSVNGSGNACVIDYIALGY